MGDNFAKPWASFWGESQCNWQFIALRSFVMFLMLFSAVSEMERTWRQLGLLPGHSAHWVFKVCCTSGPPGEPICPQRSVSLPGLQSEFRGVGPGELHLCKSPRNSDAYLFGNYCSRPRNHLLLCFFISSYAHLCCQNVLRVKNQVYVVKLIELC